MSDSDSDDDLLLSSGPVFRKNARQERAADKKRATGLAYLESSLEEEDKRRALNDTIVKIKQENLDCNEERLTQAETIAKESGKRKASMSAVENDANNNGGGLAALALRDQLATAVDTAQASTLGTRKVLGRANDKDRWSTVEFCLEELNDILKRLQTHQGNKEEKAFRADIVSFLKTSLQKGTLEQALLHRKLAKLCQRHDRMYLPKELTEWLLCLACNPIDDESSGLSSGAFQTLDTLWTRARGTSSKVVPLVTMQDVIRDFEAWFALRLMDNSALEEKENQSTGISTVSVKGLEHFLALWERAFSNDLVALDQESAKETATQIMVALARASLDPCFYICPGLLLALQRVIRAFLSFVERNIASDQNDVKEWIAVTVTAVLDQCNKLSRPASSTTQNDDDEMWLCLSLMTRTLSTFDDCTTSIVDDIHRQFRAAIAIQALRKCLEIEDWDQHMQTVLSERGETELPVRASSSLAWRAIASSYAGFLTIPSLGSAVTKNGQRCLATVKLITYCILAGITYHSSPIDLDSEDEESKGVFGTTQEASLLLRILEVLESEGRQLGSRVSAFSSDPNFSRAEYLLSCLRRYGDHTRLKACACAGQAAGSPVSTQKSIHNYFGNSPE